MFISSSRTPSPSSSPVPSPITPEAFLRSTPHEAAALHPHIPALSLFDIRSEATPNDKEPLFISVLLHGNEVSGWQAIRLALAKYAASSQSLTRPILLLVGNTEAAAQCLRHLANQPDFNRIWPGSAQNACPEIEHARGVFQTVLQRRPIVHLDIHNNSGRNPFYCVIGKTDSVTLGLAQLFSHQALYFPKARGDATNAFAQFGAIPSVTMECGLPGLEAHAMAAAEMIEAVLRINQQSDLSAQLQPKPLQIYETLACIRLAPTLKFDIKGRSPGRGSDHTQCDSHTAEGTRPLIQFRHDLDTLNFQPCPPGTIFAEVHCLGKASAAGILEHILTLDDGQQAISSPLFGLEGHFLVNTRPFTPAMLTCDARIARSDCLGYALQPYQADLYSDRMRQSA